MRRVQVLVVAALAAVVSACAPGAEQQDGPPPLDPEMVAWGRQIYDQSCAACHGPEGEGVPGWQERNQWGELPPPPHDSTGHTWRHSDGMLYRMVRDGWRDPFNRTERLTMPPFGDVLSPEEIRAVITYVKTWWTPKQRQFQWEETRTDPFPQEAEL